MYWYARRSVLYVKITWYYVRLQKWVMGMMGINLHIMLGCLQVLEEQRLIHSHSRSVISDAGRQVQAVKGRALCWVIIAVCLLFVQKSDVCSTGNLLFSTTWCADTYVVRYYAKITRYCFFTGKVCVVYLHFFFAFICFRFHPVITETNLLFFFSG